VGLRSVLRYDGMFPRPDNGDSPSLPHLAMPPPSCSSALALRYGVSVKRSFGFSLSRTHRQNITLMKEIGLWEERAAHTSWNGRRRVEEEARDLAPGPLLAACSSRVFLTPLSGLPSSSERPRDGGGAGVVRAGFVVDARPAGTPQFMHDGSWGITPRRAAVFFP